MTRFLPCLLAICVSFAAAQNSTSNSTTEGWGGCVFPNNPTKSTDVKIGEPTPICITVGPGGSWAAGVPYIRWVFTPVADQYSYFRIPDSYHQIVNGNGTFQGRNLTVHTASQDILSFLRVYYDPIDGRIFPFLTAIVDVEGGIVKGIAWDNACVFCSPNECLENTYNFDGVLQSQESLAGQSMGCYITKEECDNSQDQKNNKCTSAGTCIVEGQECTPSDCQNDCDVRVYVVWTGSDVDGKPFQSSSSRFSAFPAQRIQDRVLSLFPPIPEFPNISDITGINRP